MHSLCSVITVSACLLGALALPTAAWSQEDEPVFPEFQETFAMPRHDLQSRGVNDYYTALVPGYELLLAGDDEGEAKTLLISTLRHTKVVAGVRCAVVREMEWTDGELVEISWNYFAISRRHGGIFYFGEDVDIYEDGEVVSHAGAWLAGESGNQPGLIMPAYPLVGSRYYQEIAPGIALDRAEHLSITEPLVTLGGTFANCLFVEESTPLEPDHFSYKHYAPGVGLVKDGPVELVAYGFRVRLPAGLEDAPKRN